MHKCFCELTEKSVIIRAYLIKSPRYHCIWKYVAPVGVTLTHSELAGMINVIFASYGAKGSTLFNLLNPAFYACLLNWLPVVGHWLQKFNEIRRRASFSSCEASLISLSGCECMHILSNRWCWEAWNQEATFHLSATHHIKLCSHSCCLLTASVYRWWLLFNEFFTLLLSSMISDAVTQYVFLRSLHLFYKRGTMGHNNS